MQKHRSVALAISLASLLTSCISAVPILRDADMVLSGAAGGHLYPPTAYTEDHAWLKTDVEIKRVPGHQVGTTCNLFGNYIDRFVAECVRKRSDGSIIIVLPTCPEFSQFYCDVAEQHAWGHVFQAKTGLEMNHVGWGRFNAPTLVAQQRDWTVDASEGTT